MKAAIYQITGNNSLENKNSSLGIILDNITDPNNVGAIYRSAYAFNADFIISEKKKLTM